jgi:hypothetical protein
LRQGIDSRLSFRTEATSLIIGKLDEDFVSCDRSAVHRQDKPPTGRFVENPTRGFAIEFLHVYRLWLCAWHLAGKDPGVSS